MILTNETDERMHIGYHISSTERQADSGLHVGIEIGPD